MIWSLSTLAGESIMLMEFSNSSLSSISLRNLPPPKAEPSGSTKYFAWEKYLILATLCKLYFFISTKKIGKIWSFFENVCFVKHIFKIGEIPKCGGKKYFVESLLPFQGPNSFPRFILSSTFTFPFHSFKPTATGQSMTTWSLIF